MNVNHFINSLKSDPEYRNQIVHIEEFPRREAQYGKIAASYKHLLEKTGYERIYTHQTEAIDLALQNKDICVVTGTASGKTLCYTIPILKKLEKNSEAKALLLFPTKALCQDQFKNFTLFLERADLNNHLTGVYDGDTLSSVRRKLRESSSVIFSNPDMVHATMMPHHAWWVRFFSGLKIIVLDELHIYNGIFGSNMAMLLHRLFRICNHYGSNPQIIACSATIANPKEFAENLIHRHIHVIDYDTSPRGKKKYVFWNPPRIRGTISRCRKSANLEAQEIMAKLVEQKIPTITFSKAKITAELIHRYVTEKLHSEYPSLASKVVPYRGGYLPEERRGIEKMLFAGKLLGVSTTPALELGIDVGGLEACIVVGYPGTRTSFFQQAGRAGRNESESVVFLIGLDTIINQYVMNHPEYLFDRGIEHCVIDPYNPFVITGHLRCAAHELAVSREEVSAFGPYGEMVLNVLEENLKVKELQNKWYYSASEIPHHEISLRAYADANVVIEDVDSGKIIGEVNRYDSEALVHPEAIYMQLGETFRVLDLDLDKNIAKVKKVEVDYYTQPMGGTDVHHVDNRLKEKRFGTGMAYWGEVTSIFNTQEYEKIKFYTLDAVERKGVNLPSMTLETMAVWIVPPEDLMETVRKIGLDPFNGCRGIGYATRNMIPLHVTCKTLDFSHTIGSINSEWNAIFIYERYPHGLGFTEKVFNLLEVIMPRVYENIKKCPCEIGCPCCVGKSLRGKASWNVERGEGAIPYKEASLIILEGMLKGIRKPQIIENERSDLLRTEQMLRRRLERMREPKLLHPIRPFAEMRTEFPEAEEKKELSKPDVVRRKERRSVIEKEFGKRLSKKLKKKQR